MKNRKLIFLIMAATYALLLALSLNHNSINIKPTNAPQYIGRNSFTKK